MLFSCRTCNHLAAAALQRWRVSPTAATAPCPPCQWQPQSRSSPWQCRSLPTATATNRGPTPRPATGKALPWLQRPLTNPGGQESSTSLGLVPRKNQTKWWGFPTPPSATQSGPAALPVVYRCTASFSCCITRISASAWAGCLGWGFDMPARLQDYCWRSLFRQLIRLVLFLAPTTTEIGKAWLDDVHKLWCSTFPWNQTPNPLLHPSSAADPPTTPC